jgi:outer membrane protein assembly factor BamB
MKKVWIILGLSMLFCTTCSLFYEEPAWIINPGCYVSTAAIGHDGTIYVVVDENNLYVLNPDGTVKWQIKPSDSYTMGTPVIGPDGTIYVADYNHASHTPSLYAFTPDGAMKWKFENMGRSLAIAEDGTIYCMNQTGLKGERFLTAIEPGDTTVKWKFGVGHVNPVIGTDGTLFFWDSIPGEFKEDEVQYTYLISLDPDDGGTNWVYKTEARRWSSLVIGSDGTLYAAGEEVLYAFSPEGTVKWFYEVQHDDEFPEPYVVISPPSVGTDGTIYFGTNSPYLFALNPEGTLKWKCKIDGVIRTNKEVSIGADGTIFFTWGGDLYSISPEGDVSRNRIMHEKDELGSGLPVIDSDGTVYFSYATKWTAYFLAFETDCGGLADSPWPKFRADNQNTGRAR